jgi:hypothetical protein
MHPKTDNVLRGLSVLTSLYRQQSRCWQVTAEPAGQTAYTNMLGPWPVMLRLQACHVLQQEF